MSFEIEIEIEVKIEAEAEAEAEMRSLTRKINIWIMRKVLRARAVDVRSKN